MKNDFGYRTLVRLKEGADAALARADLAIIHRSAYERWVRELHEYRPPVSGGGPTDPALRLDNSRLIELHQRYRSLPGATSSQWSEAFVATEIDLAHFRADNAYVYQRRLYMQPVNYALTAFYVQRYSPLKLYSTLAEDTLYGAMTLEIDGRLVSRDLLDSINELSFLEEELGLSEMRRPTILDIGAGYGRLAHRATSAFDLTYLCTDAVAVSTYLSEFYLRVRDAPGASVLPLDEVSGALRGKRIDIALNVHSFSECPLSAITWWLELIAQNDVVYLMIVPNTDELLSMETSGRRLDYRVLIESHGFTLVTKRPKYAHSEAAQQYGLYPAQYYLFRRK